MLPVRRPGHTKYDASCFRLHGKVFVNEGLAPFIVGLQT